MLQAKPFAALFFLTFFPFTANAFTPMEDHQLQTVSASAGVRIFIDDVVIQINSVPDLLFTDTDGTTRYHQKQPVTEKDRRMTIALTRDAKGTLFAIPHNRTEKKPPSHSP